MGQEKRPRRGSFVERSEVPIGGTTTSPNRNIEHRTLYRQKASHTKGFQDFNLCSGKTPYFQRMYIVNMIFLCYTSNIHKMEIQRCVFMTKTQKKKITLSLPVETDIKIEELAKKFGLTKSGLVNLLVNKASENGTIFN